MLTHLATGPLLPFLDGYHVFVIDEAGLTWWCLVSAQGINVSAWKRFYGPGESEAGVSTDAGLEHYDRPPFAPKETAP